LGVARLRVISLEDCFPLGLDFRAGQDKYVPNFMSERRKVGLNGLDNTADLLQLLNERVKLASRASSRVLCLFASIFAPTTALTGHWTSNVMIVVTRLKLEFVKTTAGDGAVLFAEGDEHVLT